MGMKKKAVTTFLAMTLVLGSLAGVPLSTEGLMEQLGVGIAHADVLADSGITDKLNSIHNKLTESEKEAIRNARGKLEELNDTSVVAATWGKISAKIAESDQSYDLLTPEHLLELVKATDFIYDESYTSLTAAINDSDNRAFLAQLAALGGLGGSGNDITSSDAVDFAEAIEAELKKQLSAKTTAELVALAADIASVKKELKVVMDNVINDQSLKLSLLLRNLNITGEILMSDYEKLNQAVDTSDNAAQMALIAAYVRTETKLETAAVAGSWNKLSLVLTAWGQTIPNELITWEVEGDLLSKDATGKIVYNATVNQTATVKATLTAKVLSKVIYTNTVDLTFTYTNSTTNDDENDDDDKKSSHGGGGGGGGGVVTNTNVTVPDKGKAEERLKEVTGKLADLVKGANAEGLKRAQEAIQSAIREAATIDLSAVVKVEGDAAKPTIDAAKFTEVFQVVKEIAKLGNDQLKSAAPDAKPAKIIATLDLGTVGAKSTQVPLSKELIAGAKEYGIEALAVKVNGVTLAVDLDQLPEDTNVTIAKGEKTDATSVTKLVVASEVYDFSFDSNGSQLESFTKPVEVRIPVTNESGVDTELLVLAKLDGGSLVFKSGKYDAAKKELVAYSKSFSKYAVIENKISFSDIASVQEWAGRQIAVAAAKGILEGRGDAQFVPDDKVTRAEFAKMLVKTFMLEDATAEESFADVDDSDWYKPYVAAAVKAGLVEGREADKFAPNATITRAEMATMAARALTTVLGYKQGDNAEAALKGFTDAESIHASLKDGVSMAAAEGIVIGEDDGKFNPDADSTRAQAAVVIYRLLNK